MISFELFNVIVTNYGKWYKSGKTNSHRRYGFCISFVISILWAVYFAGSEQYWLAGNSIITLAVAVRGFVNNPKGVKNAI